jgi:hypothetical protein
MFLVQYPGWVSYSNLCPMLEICALRPSFPPNFASCIFALRPSYCIFSKNWVHFTLYVICQLLWNPLLDRTPWLKNTSLNSLLFWYLIPKFKTPQWFLWQQIFFKKSLIRFTHQERGWFYKACKLSRTVIYSYLRFENIFLNMES